MRFRFRGLYRETAEPVEGHVDAPEENAAYQVLSDRGIVTETLQPDLQDVCEPGHEQSHTPDISLVDNTLEEALDNALDASSTRVPFDALTHRYRGKKVRVIDRDKIRMRVAQVVDSTLAASEANPDGEMSARERVAEAINKLFQDPRNLATDQLASTIAKISDPKLADRIGKLTGVVEQAETLIAAMQAALRNAESGTAPRRHMTTAPLHDFDAEQSAVLLEILKSNLELRRQMEQSTTRHSPSPQTKTFYGGHEDARND